MNIIFGLFVGATVVQILFYVLVFSRLAFYSKNNKNTDTVKKENDLPPISVVICAKNEAPNLSKNLPIILEQVYPNFEVLVVNDASEDNTLGVLHSFQSVYKQLRILNVKDAEKRGYGKKFALSTGICAATYDYLLLTDADCLPNSRFWIRDMARLFSKEKQIVLGYGPYFVQKGWLNKWVQFETLYTALQYFSFALMGYPYMGVGRNLAYHRSLFEQANGFKQHQHIPSGDDDLFVGQVAQRVNTTICLQQTTFCYSTPPSTFQEWYQQKHRHLSTGKHYAFTHQLLLGSLSLSHFLFYTTFLVVFISSYKLLFITLLFFLRLSLQIIVFKKTTIYLNGLSVGWLLLLDCLYVLYYCIFAPSLFLNHKVSWNTSTR